MSLKTTAKTVLLLCAVILLSFVAFCETKSSKKTEYMLKAKDNSLVLFENGKQIKKYGDVNISGLPIRDIDELTKGIKVKTVDEAESIIENYDG